MTFGYLFVQASVLPTCKATDIYFFIIVYSFQEIATFFKLNNPQFYEVNHFQ